MKIDIDNDSHIILKEDIDSNTASFSIKVKKEFGGYILMSVNLDSDIIDELISELITVRAKIDSRR
jgi:hypothetical protein